MKIYLAIGLNVDEGTGEVHSFSRETTSRDPVVVAEMLREENWGDTDDSEGYHFEQILLVASGRHSTDSPTVVEHWNLSEDYGHGHDDEHGHGHDDEHGCLAEWPPRRK